MRPFQFSLRALLGLVAVVAVSCAALSQASYLWASAVWTLTIALLAMAVVASACSSGRVRAFWLGFAVLGWIHAVLAFGPWCAGTTSKLLLSRQLLDAVAGFFGHEAPQLPGVPTIWENLTFSHAVWRDPGYAATGGRVVRYWNYLIVGQSLISIAIAFFGGVAARWLYAARERPGEKGEKPPLGSS